MDWFKLKATYEYGGQKFATILRVRANKSTTAIAKASKALNALYVVKRNFKLEKVEVVE